MEMYLNVCNSPDEYKLRLAILFVPCPSPIVTCRPISHVKFYDRFFSFFTSRTFDRWLTIRWNRRLNVQLRTPCAVKRRERPRIVGSNDRAKQQRGSLRTLADRTLSALYGRCKCPKNFSCFAGVAFVPLPARRIIVLQRVLSSRPRVSNFWKCISESTLCALESVISSGAFAVLLAVIEYVYISRGTTREFCELSGPSCFEMYL